MGSGMVNLSDSQQYCDRRTDDFREHDPPGPAPRPVFNLLSTMAQLGGKRRASQSTC
jgi:hypothetical protein